MPLRAISIAIMLALLTVGQAEAQDMNLWESYKHQFLSNDGRIVDRGQNKTSHSEGQGYGMQLAVLHNDRETFDKLWHWTKYNLRIRSDNLFAWHWGKRPNNEWQVLDYNNATDGDIIIAFALLQASDQWQSREYRDEALKTIRDIRTLLSIAWQGHTFLLPGYYGFDRNNGVLLNPSYLIFPAFRAFSRIDNEGFWNKVHQDGLFLIEQSCFGSPCLPPNWVELAGDRIEPAGGKDSYFGAEAVRVLLAMTTLDAPRFPRGVSTLLDQYRTTGRVPLWIDMKKDSASLKPATAGYYAIYSLVAKKLGDRKIARLLMEEAKKRLKNEQDAYYSFSLFLLATAGKETI